MWTVVKKTQTVPGIYEEVCYIFILYRNIVVCLQLKCCCGGDSDDGKNNYMYYMKKSNKEYLHFAYVQGKIHIFPSHFQCSSINKFHQQYKNLVFY